MAATKAVEKFIEGKTPIVYRSKSSMARDLKCDRKTITAMIERGEIKVNPDGAYQIASIKK